MPQNELSILIIDRCQEYTSSLLYREQKIVSQVDNSLDVVPPMIPTLDRDHYRRLFVKSRELVADIERIFVAKCVADTI
jgi:thymidine kinase